MKGIKVLLINPNPVAHWDRRIPFGLAYLAASIRKDFYVEIIDMPAEDFSEREAIEYIKQKGFAIVGITGMTHQISSAYRLAGLIKKEDLATVVMGGCHVTFCPQEALSAGVDFVVIGEGERVFRALLQTISGGNPEYSKIEGLAYKDASGNIITNPRGRLLDINELPPPARDLLPMKKYLDAKIYGRPALEFMFGRGCPHNCIFCSSPGLWERRVRVFDLERVIKEIKEVTRQYANRRIFITDDVFTIKREFVMDFCKETKNLKIKWSCLSRVDLVDEEMLLEMKRSGCLRVSYGVESGNQEILDFEQKGTTIAKIKEVFKLHRRIGLPASALFIVGHPKETKETIKQSLGLAKELSPFSEVYAQMMTPYIGTELFSSIARKTGRITSYNWDDYLSWKFPPVYIANGLDAETIYNAALEFQKIKGTNLFDYLTAFKLAGFDIFSWDFFFRPIIANFFKRILPKFVVNWVKNLRKA